VDYLLHDQPVRFLKGKLRLRQVTRWCDDGHQTQGNVSRKPASIVPAVQKVALMLRAGQTGRAVVAPAPTAAKAY
jgi:hypothetical protein